MTERKKMWEVSDSTPVECEGRSYREGVRNVNANFQRVHHRRDRGGRLTTAMYVERKGSGCYHPLTFMLLHFYIEYFFLVLAFSSTDIDLKVAIQISDQHYLRNEDVVHLPVLFTVGFSYFVPYR